MIECVRGRKEGDHEGENEGGTEKLGEQLFTVIIIILIHHPPNYWISKRKRGDNTLELRFISVRSFIRGNCFEDKMYDVNNLEIDGNRRDGNHRTNTINTMWCM